MFSRIAHQAAAFSLAAAATLSLFLTVQVLATSASPAALLTDSAAPVQVVVITGHRVARS